MTRKGYPPPPTAREHDRMVRWHQRHTAIPGYLKSVEKWLAEICANPNDIRNTPDIRPRRGGGTYISGVTDLKNIPSSIASIRAKLRAGDYLLAQSAVDGLRSVVGQINARKTNKEASVGANVLKKVRENLQPHNDDRRKRRQRPRAILQDKANKIWARNPTYSKNKVARILQAQEHLSEQIDTIARHLKKPRMAA